MAKEKKVINENKNFMKDFKAELKKVVWPSSKQMVSNVTTVVAIVLIVAIITLGLDLFFGGVKEFGVNNLKKHVDSKNQSQTQIVNDITSEQQTENNNIEENNSDVQTNTEEKSSSEN